MKNMKAGKKHILPEKIIDAVILLLIVLSAALLVFQFYSPGTKTAGPALNSFFILQPQSVTEEVIPEYAGVRRTYQFDMSKLPVSSARTRSFFVYLRHTIATIEINGKTAFDTGEDQNVFHIGHTPGNYWLSIPIYDIYYEKPISLTLTPVYHSVRNEQPVFYLIDREPLLNMIVLPNEMPLIAMSVFVITTGIFLMIIAATIWLDPQDRARLLYLGAFSTAGGVWKLCGLSAATLVMDYTGQQKFIWYTGICCYMLMLVFSLRHFAALRSDDSSRTGKACCLLSAAVSILLLILQAANLAELHETLVWYGIGMAVLHLLALLGHKPNRDEILWLVPAFLSLAIDLGIYLKNGSISTAPVFMLWIILNLFIRGFGFLRLVIRRERELRVKDEELRGAKIQTLISQIRPHFIFNTLASVNMICEENPKRATEIISDFSQYLQSNFSALSTSELIPFSEEMKHVKAYLDVEAALYEDQLSVDYDTAFTAFRLPPLTLQPIVENCIKHGFGGDTLSLHIIIRTRQTGTGAEIQIEDNGQGYDPSPDGAIHIGLTNAKERLELMCGGTLQLEPGSAGTLVTVIIPA